MTGPYEGLYVVSMEKIGRRITRRREARGLTKTALARKAGITRATLVRIEDGTHTPMMNTLQRIAKALGVKVRDLLPKD